MVRCTMGPSGVTANLITDRRRGASTPSLVGGAAHQRWAALVGMSLWAGVHVGPCVSPVLWVQKVSELQSFRESEHGNILTRCAVVPPLHRHPSAFVLSICFFPFFGMTYKFCGRGRLLE